MLAVKIRGPAASDKRTVYQQLAFGLAVGAGLAHFMAVIEGTAAPTAYLGGLLVIGVMQLAAALLLAVRPRRASRDAVALGTLGVLGAYYGVHNLSWFAGLESLHGHTEGGGGNYAAPLAVYSEMLLLGVLALWRLPRAATASVPAPKALGRAVPRPRARRRARPALALGVVMLVAAPTWVLATQSGSAAVTAPGPVTCERTLTANVVAVDQVLVYNRLGVKDLEGMVYALRGDLVKKSDGGAVRPNDRLTPGSVTLSPSVRPRPLTLRMNVGDCLQVAFQNLISQDVLATKDVGFHVTGMQLVSSISDDGSNVGQNPGSLVAPGGKATYKFYAEREGTFLAYSQGDTVSAEGIGTFAHGLFGAVNVEPRGSEWYRSQVTRAEMEAATTGTTAGGQPIINYDATASNNGLPILKILDGTEIVHADLNAIITGPNKGNFPAGTYVPNPTYPNRNQPFREFTVVFHDEVAVQQAFPIFDDPQFKFTLHGVKDGFAINYATGGIGAEIVANRLGVGPMWDCPECKYEEFFLTSWVVGDPGMIVDVPANAVDASGQLIAGPKATKALYPSDPSSVFNSYLNDHVKIRNLHAGKEHHVFHLHAHQWLFTPDDDNSNYLDSQGIGPGAGYTYEIAYNGSGNRNKTVGDAIFHCHFYPHFAQGMWALWRVHDTFEGGTALDAAGRPAAGARALPDGEIAAGTPIPALVPIPTLPMAPVPGATVSIAAGEAQIDGAGNPGYPFFIAAEAGHRPPTPPLDIVDDGGLRRHVITGAAEVHTVTTPLDMSRELIQASARFFDEAGTATEQAAMKFHEQRLHPTFRPDGTAAQFETNGLPRIAGAPYADPCRTDSGAAIATNRIYKGANIQFDMKINKKGWHHPQSRIVTLWNDVQPTLDGTRAPEPFVMRANSGDCINFYHTNLVPSVYEQDAFQVKTPTDIIGQHIHLVKFDVTSADGSGNGFNYEDGTMSPDEIRERIRAIRKNTNALNAANPVANPEKCTGDEVTGNLIPDKCPLAAEHPFFGAGPDGTWRGARTTIQRWWADPVLNNQGVDRGLGNVFTHDHYGPSTHQQIGLYATLLSEPTGSTWRNPETGTLLGTRQSGPTADGGPTSWRADILTANPADSYREFYFEFADFHLAYEAGRGIAAGKPISDPAGAINPPGRIEAGLPDIFAEPQACPNGTPFLPNGCPEAIAAQDTGTFSVNYRNEPLALRTRDPATNSQAAGDAGDLAQAFSSKIQRADAALNTQPSFYPPLTGGVGALDPYTPLLRSYVGDKVRIRVQVGAHEEGHNISIYGMKWTQEYASENSGWRNSQMAGISEQFQFLVPPNRDAQSPGPAADYLYQMSASVDGLWNGAWGIFRSYKVKQQDLLELPNNAIGTGLKFTNEKDFNGICPVSATVRKFDVSAVAASAALPNGRLVYNSRTVNGGPLSDPTAIMYVRTADLDPQGKLKNGVPVEPLVLRAASGECIEVTLQNKLPATLADLDGFNALAPIVDGYNANDIHPSKRVGLHPQLVAYDVTNGDGINVGTNPGDQTVLPGAKSTFLWYAGDVRIQGNALVATPMEFGATNLISADRLKHSNKGAIGSLIIEPAGSTWVEDATGRASATVTAADGSKFRDFVLQFQDDLNLRLGAGNGTPIPFVRGEEDAEDSGNKALNYRSEPLWLRMGIPPAQADVRGFNFAKVLSNTQVGGDPQTPIFKAVAGEAIRIRVLQSGGHARNHVFALHGHVWQREPYVAGSTRIGSNPLSTWRGSQEGHGPTDHFDIVPSNGAGGGFRVAGDYLIRDGSALSFYQGTWGLLRVTNK